MNFNGHYLKILPTSLKTNISIPKKVMNLCISVTVGPNLRNLNTDFK